MSFRNSQLAMGVLLATTVLCLSGPTSAANSRRNLKYQCEGGSNTTIGIEVVEKNTLLINGNDMLMIDPHYAAQRLNTRVFELIGYAQSLGDGHSGEVVVVNVSKQIFRGSKVVELYTFHRSPRGSYKESYTCTLTN